MIPKFRALVKAEKIMLPVGEIDFDYEFAYIEEENGYRCERDFDEIEFMQFTELKDKNGKEIFEGDVVKLFDKDLYVVEWSSQEASYKLIPVDKQWSDCYFSNYENITKIIEVIGNIWEDGELLNS